MESGVEVETAGLLLVEEEEDGFVFKVQEENNQSFDPNLCLVGRFMTNQPMAKYGCRPRV